MMIPQMLMATHQKGPICSGFHIKTPGIGLLVFMLNLNSKNTAAIANRCMQMKRRL
jgi:hypothetical protein